MWRLFAVGGAAGGNNAAARLYGVAAVTSYDILSDAEVQTLEAGSEIVYEDATFSSEYVSCVSRILCCCIPHLFVFSSAVNPEVGSVSWARISREGHFGQETTTWLDPRRFNLHNIQASSDIGCAMLDIMVPPYDKYIRKTHCRLWLVGGDQLRLTERICVFALRFL